jgi:hypothetical protein
MNENMDQKLDHLKGIPFFLNKKNIPSKFNILGESDDCGGKKQWGHINIGPIFKNKTVQRERQIKDGQCHYTSWRRYRRGKEPPPKDLRINQQCSIISGNPKINGSFPRCTRGESPPTKLSG